MIKDILYKEYSPDEYVARWNDNRVDLGDNTVRFLKPDLVEMNITPSEGESWTEKEFDEYSYPQVGLTLNQLMFFRREDCNKRVYYDGVYEFDNYKPVCQVGETALNNLLGTIGR